MECIHKQEEGQLGGILVAWDVKVLEVIDSVVRNYSVSVKSRNKEDDWVWAFSVVYGLCEHAEFGRLREELSGVRERWQVLWCAGGILMWSNFLTRDWGLVR